MHYKIEQIGAQFSNKDIASLETRLTQLAQRGYKFHTVFQIRKTGCLGIGTPAITYLAVYLKE